MKKLALAIAYCLFLAGAARAVEMLRPEQIRPGARGYGLSVFKGTEPQRFEVEVLGVLKNAMPKQDMILIRMSGANLEQHKVIAGMSGSPIYIEDKLIGALAYGWTFENEPLAGVTPIHNMLGEIDRPAPARTTSPFTLPAAPLPKDAGTAPRPLLTPLALGGFSPRTLALFAEEFERWGLLPVAAGGSAGGARKRPRGTIVPGGSIGVELVRGDLNATGVGTATHIVGNRILAFGHPFFQAGQLMAPAVQAEVITIMSSVERSFKIATAVADVGAMVGDWQSCIVADTTATAPMIPVTVNVANRDTQHRERYELEVVDNQRLSPLLVQMAILQTVSAASGSSQDTMVRVELTAETGTRTVRIANTFFNPLGGLVNRWSWAPLAAMFQTPFGRTPIQKITATVTATQNRQTAIIKGAYFTKSEAERGETVALKVLVKPFDQPETTLTFPVKVPAATDSLRTLTVVILSGAEAPSDIAPPDNLNDFLDALEKDHKNTDLVALVRLPGQGLQYRGKLLKNLPPSALDVLNGDGNNDITGTADMRQIVLATDWVLSGRAIARIPIRQE